MWIFSIKQRLFLLACAMYAGLSWFYEKVAVERFTTSEVFILADTPYMSSHERYHPIIPSKDDTLLVLSFCKGCFEVTARIAEGATPPHIEIGDTVRIWNSNTRWNVWPRMDSIELYSQSKFRKVWTATSK